MTKHLPHHVMAQGWFGSGAWETMEELLYPYTEPLIRPQTRGSVDCLSDGSS